MVKTSAVVGLTSLVILTMPTLAADNFAGIDVVSAYVFRGVTYNDGPCIQPYLETVAGELTFSLWTNFDLQDYGPVNSGDFSEIDFSLSYGYQAGPTECTVGIIQFLFPESGPDANTRELFVTASLPLVEEFELSTYAGYDFDLVDDFYTSLGVTFCIPLESPRVMLSYKAGYAGDKTALGGTSGFHDHELRFDASYSISERGDLGAFFVFTDSIDDDVLPKQDINFLAGFRLNYSL
jgi:hypothetical protein